MKNIFFLFLSTILANSSSYSQAITPQIVASSGEQYSDSITTISWTLGETITETYTGNLHTITQGFHQSEVKISSIDKFPVIQNIKFYPNPTAEQLIIESSIENLPLQIELFDVNGKLLLTTVWKQNSNYTVPLSLYASGSYFLRIKSINEKQLNMYTVIKK